MMHRCRECTFGIQSLKNHQPRHHPGAQRVSAREPRLPEQYASHLLLGNGQPVSLERPCHLRWADNRFGGVPVGALLFLKTKLSLVHSLSYRILEHFHSFMSSLLATENMPLSGIGHSCLRHVGERALP